MEKRLGLFSEEEMKAQSVEVTVLENSNVSGNAAAAAPFFVTGCAGLAASAAAA